MVRALIDALRDRRGWLPRRVRPRPWPSLLPRDRVHWASCVLLWTLLVAYVLVWANAHHGYLFDPLLQNDDARTSLFPFHVYGPERTLADDPIAAEMLARQPPAVWLTYRVLTPAVGLFFASKVVQLLAFAMVAWAALILARGRRGGLAAGLLLVFLTLHTPYVVNRIGGGHSRAFAFPLMALWTAGVLAPGPRTRFASTAAAALIYPPVMLILLTAEGLLALRGVRVLRGFRARIEIPVLAGRLKRLAVLAAVCALFTAPQLGRHGRMHTLAEARLDPVFVHSPRRALPFAAPLPVSAAYFAHPWHANGGGPVVDAYERLGLLGAAVLAALLVWLVASRRAPLPRAGLALLGAAILTYVAARLVAFRLYNPIRYLSYGMVASSLAVGLGVLGMMWPQVRPRAVRATRRNFAAVAAVGGIWLVAGDGLIGPDHPARDGAVHHNGMSIDERREAPLYAFMRSLPPHALVALHPGDGAGITYWTGRATTEHFETLTPWWVEPWRRARTRTEDTLEALYAVDAGTLMDYCDRYGITHLLVNTGRYQQDFRRRAHLFPPFDEHVDELLAGVERADLVVPRLPPQAIVYLDGPWAVFDVARLRAAISEQRSADKTTGEHPGTTPLADG